MNSENFQDSFLNTILRDNTLIDSSIIPIGNLTQRDIVKIYQNDYRARMFEVLSENYESLWHIMGDEEFEKCCMQYIQTHHSSFKDLRFYGDQLPDFLLTTYCQNFPFIYDLACFEKTFWNLFHLPPVEPRDVFSEVDFGLLAHYKIKLGVNISLISSKWDVLSIWQNREKKFEEIEYDFDQEIFVILFKQNHNVKMLKVTKDQFTLLKLLGEGNSFLETFEKHQTTTQVVAEVFSLMRSNFIPVILSI